MKAVPAYLNRIILIAICLFLSLVKTESIHGQICANPATTVYGLTPTGGVYPITISNGTTGAAITPANSGNAPSVSNAMGYNPNSGKFYYFKRNCNQAPQEFVVFDPGAMTVTVKANCPTTNEIHCGCVTNDGLGYYAIDVNSNLYYYNIWMNTWTVIGNVFRDQNNNNVTPILASHNSGDIAIDGNGNLWILCSSFGEYGLYELNAPLPTTPQLQMNLRRVILPTTPTPGGDAFAGIAFNPTGQLIMSMYFTNKLYRLENNYSLTFLGTMSVNNVGNDLTSCAYPLGVLPVLWESFTTSLTENLSVKLDWTASSETYDPVFTIEHSSDGKNWHTLGSIESDAPMGTRAKFTYTHSDPKEGMHEYRIKQVTSTGHAEYSEVRTVMVKREKRVTIWPNPVRDIVHIQTPWKNEPVLISIHDQAGSLIKQFSSNTNVNEINLGDLQKGVYMVVLKNAGGNSSSQKIVKQ